ncbi:HmuY family protein [Chryseobacterium sp. MYb264]|uniref:HmuY family protein n=1 Tax=Chryseobacterium sp. MYb264 TaxID=2745153 RepID=UPI002E0D5A71|nr:HmuY family protein [Chryseobacterium sp. MYb264]
MKKILFYILIGTSFVAQSCINDNEDPVAVLPSDGIISDANVGGPTQPNQVWIDLSDISIVNGKEGPKETLTKRTDWDMGFYSGSSFKVIINSSVMMAAGKITGATNIDLVKESDVAALKNQVQVASFNPANVAYVDNVNGNFPTDNTAIADVNAVDSENAIYLVNMGKDLYTGSVPVGSIATGGDSRGWMKVQVVRSGDGYKVKYAELGATTHKELTIAKNAAYNFNFVSLKNNKEVFIQPEKNKWDISFTVFTNIIEGAGTYVYGDFVTTNIVGGAGSYEVKVAANVAAQTYKDFKKADVDASKFIYNDQRSIGPNWRNPVGVNGLEVYGDRFYIIKDPEGNYFKLKFSRITDKDGVRGFPQFEYNPL